ncbi:MAG: bifunctional phosphopantothenoylcysteine decarboxylase/phosphopantothenate--cysteine ligase CoaBC [Candidatus Nanopelagicales bacterium]
MPKVLLGVSGGVSAYKSVSLARLLKEAGADLTIVPTPSALNFVGKATWEAISGKPVYAEVFEATDRVAHVALAREADLVVVAPATADLIYRAAAGAGNDMLSSILLTHTKRVIFFPAMHSEMWLNPATQANVSVLRERGHLVVNPATGALARGDEGIGRLPEPEQIVRLIKSYLEKTNLINDFQNIKALVTLGGTSEKIDPVRSITNRSTGEMGAAICRALYLRGADVTAIAANHSAVLPHDVNIISVNTVAELAKQTKQEVANADLIVMAAAVSDFTATAQEGKISRTGKVSLELQATEDILAGLGESKNPNQFLVGFAAQSSDVIAAGKAKLLRKKCDLIVANEIGEELGFGDRKTEIHLISETGVVSTGEVSKDAAAHAILDEIARKWQLQH